MKDLSSLSALSLLSKPLSGYFIKQKYFDLWIFAHGTTGKSFSDVDVDNMTDIADFVIIEIDVNQCRLGPSHHFQLLPCVHSNPHLKENILSFIRGFR